MNRKTVTAVLLALSTIVNVVFFVFASIQKTATNTAKQEALDLRTELSKVEVQLKAELHQCEGLLNQSDDAREACERKLLTISIRK